MRVRDAEHGGRPRLTADRRVAADAWVVTGVDGRADRPAGGLGARQSRAPGPRHLDADMAGAARPAAWRRAFTALADSRAAATARRMLGRGEHLGVRAEQRAAVDATDAEGMAADVTAVGARGAVDRVLVVVVAALIIIGLTMVYSASQYAVPGDPGYWFRKQLVWATAGVVALAAFARVDYRAWRRVSLWGMLLSLALLVLVLKVGTTTYGAQRWIVLGPLSIQPSELAKLAMVVYVADWLAAKGDDVTTVLYGLIPFGLVTGLVLALVVLQNDLGTAIIIGGMALAMFFAAGANIAKLVPTITPLAVLGFFGLVLGRGFRRARLAAFLNPLPPGCQDATSYQVCQGLISLGSGGFFGRGLGAGVLQAGYLPNPFTDSIFAVLGEELGLFGCALVLGLFAVLAFRGFRTGRRAPDVYGALLACGITCWLVLQAVVNVGAVVDAIPFTGVPLPFVSYGGSSLVVSLAAVGLL
ncbi:MAG TPA: putative peptidoglycan glycosyltransferase FtsW, partial [Ktedonobacterales bacterium]